LIPQRVNAAGSATDLPPGGGNSVVDTLSGSPPPRLLVEELARQLIAFLRSLPPHWVRLLDAYADAMANPMKLPELPPLPVLALNGNAAVEAKQKPPLTVHNITFSDIRRLLYSPIATPKPRKTSKRQQAFDAWIATFDGPGPSFPQCYDWGRHQQPPITQRAIRKLRAHCPDTRLRKPGRKPDEN
jgi:hypothetical protein